MMELNAASSCAARTTNTCKFRPAIGGLRELLLGLYDDDSYLIDIHLLSIDIYIT